MDNSRSKRGCMDPSGIPGFDGEVIGRGWPDLWLRGGAPVVRGGFPRWWDGRISRETLQALPEFGITAHCLY